jgi:hypothetical protein
MNSSGAKAATKNLGEAQGHAVFARAKAPVDYFAFRAGESAGGPAHSRTLRAVGGAGKYDNVLDCDRKAFCQRRPKSSAAFRLDRGSSRPFCAPDLAPGWRISGDVVQIPLATESNDGLLQA